ncbi:MAG: ATP-binding protein [Dissulfurispiraceae bacterium]
MRLFRPFMLIFSLLFFVSALTALELYFIKLPSVDISTKFLLIGVLTVNILALLTLIFFVGKNLFRLYIERQHKILGYKFRTKLMAIFGILILIPSTFLFVTASGLATNYINRIFSPQIKEPLNKSIELARAFYDFERERLLETARQVAKGEHPMTPQMSVHVYRAVPDDANDLIKDAFNGKGGTEVISQESGDVLRAVVPKGPGPGDGVVVVEQILPKAISVRSAKLKDLYEDYLKLESFKAPMRINYILILGFVTLMMVFTGLWVSLKISAGITIPIQSLAMATERVASGNLDTQVNVKSEDEVGLLITSFNQMVQQLKDSKISIERAYEESETRRLYLDNILQNINSGVLFLDSEGRILTLNKAACQILSVEPQQIRGKHYGQFIEGLNSADLTRLVKGIEGKEIRGITTEVKVNIKGRVLNIRVYISGIRETATSRSLGILVVFDDLTDVIKAQKVIAWQEMARRLAHEIKNPLTPIKLSTERLIKKWEQRDEHFDAIFKNSTRIIIAEVESLGRLVDIFSKYGRMPGIHRLPSNGPELIDSVVALYKGYSEVKINVMIQDDMPVINLDTEQFKRALINIIDNAIKALGNRGEIDISMKVHENNLLVEIADTGPGIKGEEKEKLFMPYFSKTKGGTGLGLAIAYNIVKDHGGTILITDNKPKGSIFTIEIPITKQA